MSRLAGTLLVAACGLAATCGLAALGCGGASPSRETGSQHVAREQQGIELSLRTTDGRIVELADQRGSPVLLFLFATYDGGSLASHRHVSRFTRETPDTVVLGIVLQLDAPIFATAFVETQAPPYTVVFDPNHVILRGASDLGRIEAIPTLIMIDAHGRECARHVGYANDRVLRSMHDIAVSRGGIIASPPEEGQASGAPSTGESRAGRSGRSDLDPLLVPDLRKVRRESARDLLLDLEAGAA